MDESRLKAAEAAYARGDWAVAAREYIAAAAGQTVGVGQALHRAGNALMKLKRFREASSVYQHALEDAEYPQRAAVAYNLGTAQVELGAFDAAVEAFERALEDPSYDGRYKALQGLAGALYNMGRIEDAAEAYRKAALADGNPDPGKALNNLGLCFMKLDRPEDAVEAYRAAVDLEGYRNRGRAAANLGVAYAALGLHEKAVESFERARDEFGYELSPSMQAAYRASKAQASAPEKVEGWSTGEMPRVAASPAAAPVPDGEDSSFFTMTEDEMKAIDREARRRERQDRGERRPSGSGWIGSVVVALLVVGAIVAGYFLGYGYPTQEMTVNGMMEAYAAGEPVASYWVAVPATDVDKAMSSLPPQWKSYAIDGVERSARSSRAQVTVTLEQGGVVTYEVSLAREGVGWKVNGVTNSFSSMDGGL